MRSRSNRPRRRRFAALAMLCSSLGILAVAAAPGAGAASYDFNWDIYASTHIAKSGMNVTVPKGTFVGSADLATGNLTGQMNLPPAKVTLSALGLVPLAEATFEMKSLQPVTGHVDLTTFAFSSTATFAIKISKVTPPGASDINLVGDDCTTATPITVSMSGVASPTAASTFTGTYTIPEFQNCQALTELLTQLMSGPGNTFTATVGPSGFPAPPPPPAPETVGGTLTVNELPINIGSTQLRPQFQGGATTPVPLPPQNPTDPPSLLGWLLQAR